MATNVDPPAYKEVVESSPQIPPASDTLVHRPAPMRVVVTQDAPEYHYEPSDYLVLSSVLSILCCVVSPIVLLITLPALALSIMSRKARQQGKIIHARTQGLVAAYLNVCAVFLAFIVGILATVLVITLSPGEYWR